MQFTDIGNQLENIITGNLSVETRKWITEKIHLIIENKSAKDLYLTYSLLPSKIPSGQPDFSSVHTDLKAYLETQKADTLQVARIHLLVKVLEADSAFFEEKVANLIQVADKTELETFLKFLVLLPEPSNYRHVAVDALRTNIASVFDAIALKNPYPALYFNDQQWNQMYLKAVFIERNLSDIMDVDSRANQDLTRIISDYAHERWAASRKINPLFWRPVAKFMDEKLIKDIQRLLDSDDILENGAGALCCFNSDNPQAKTLLNGYPELLAKVTEGTINWENLKG